MAYLQCKLISALQNKLTFRKMGLTMTSSKESSGLTEAMFSYNMLIFFSLSHPHGLQKKLSTQNQIKFNFQMSASNRIQFSNVINSTLNRINKHLSFSNKMKQSNMLSCLCQLKHDTKTYNQTHTLSFPHKDVY